MKWECTCICNTDMTPPWKVKTCVLEQDDPLGAPERCPFMVCAPHWKVVE